MSTATASSFTSNTKSRLILGTTDYTEHTTVILVLLVSNLLLLLAFGWMPVRTGRVHGIPQEGFGSEQMALFPPGFP